MYDKDFDIVCSKIDEEKEFLNFVSQDLWKNPELRYEEVHAHAVLTSALRKYGFRVQEHYFLDTAFRAEYESKSGGGATIAILLEYDALPEIGHACGHNLIAEAGLAAAIGVKAAMEADLKLSGKLVVLGTPAEEGGAGKVRLIENGAFDGVDVAMMVHPSKRNVAFTKSNCIIRGVIEYKGKEAHAAAYPWEGQNALDAAVACYNNISLLRQQIKPAWRIHAIITKGGVVPNIIPAYSRMEIYVRAPTFNELKDLQSRIEACINSAAAATSCEVDYSFDQSKCYKNLNSNKILANLFQSYGERLGMDFLSYLGREGGAGSTDMGNVSHIVPSIHPCFKISTESAIHTKEFCKASGSPDAQKPTLTVAKAMAMTGIDVLRNANILNDVKQQFENVLSEYN